MATLTDTRDARGLSRAPAPTGGVIAERARAFATARRHSHLVRVLRAALPLAAVLILAGYALVLAVGWRLSVGRMSVSGVVLTADDLTMKEPSYFGTTKGGGHYEVRARRAIVAFNQNAPIKLIDVAGSLVQPNNVVTKLKAQHGLFNNPKGELELYDGIEIDASNGLMARLSRALIYSKENKVVSNDPVSASTPTGSVQAAKMVMNTKTRLTQFRDAVTVRLVPSAGQAGIASGRDARQPIDIHSEELDIDDTQKTAHFRGKVGALQGETMLNTPYLFVKYEGKAADALGAEQQPAAGEKATRVTFLWARNGVEVTMGNDRSVTSDLADFDAAADTALFVGKVNAIQGKNTLKGGRLFVDRKTGKSRLEPDASEAGPNAGRIAATFYQAAAAGAQPKQPRNPAAADALFGSFKSDPNAPMEVEASALDIYDASKKAVFTGNVIAKQGDFVMRTVELIAFYAGQAGFTAENRSGDDAKHGQLVKMEAKQKVMITSKDGRTAIAEWANFDVKAHTAILGGGVTVVRDKDIAEGPRLKIDLATGMYRFEVDPSADPSHATERPPPAPAPSAPSEPPKAEERTCPPGKQCMLFYPKDAKEQAKKLLNKAPKPEQP
jgi:lipopolysaccharide transport protein LptA